MNIQVTKLNEKAILPQYQTAGAAGMDIHACIDDTILLQPMERRMIPTGFAMAVPTGYEAQIRARSGLSIKHGITMINGVGTIDADYRGEVGVLLVNLGQDSFEITPDMRIAQLVIAKHEHAVWQEVVQLEISERAEGGFGSTGTHIA
ncbi:deoxyuridine 5'-triphosphate nucleotidohydrolase [Candidatus Saccharibacteria bacterium RIFCSPHIGHO2_01_FULL_45_15]|jgi:dUTP pyrophosphatase|nr:MAG: deoxyuridine 5'-triphosphate nucleotidohydrolase [Candidatus Saccharibacteria bacterium RIFCSPHIGHO2_01_FULL_45_15]OGL28094.1 MAG: deoxyuridine 5'-triphosphate nucleotidohydrolase [Candidatus Saccharibacteria bacterium RIFCSPHIGHO2_02_FULL_46_12]OGL32713.1 MAG: deoxyuridine 5'-triphosphate nucleotidohydrolase [Candidatus Saccharibacteria bacterium RIFCSPHIGHO2_12_FULL_44_22]